MEAGVRDPHAKAKCNHTRPKPEDAKQVISGLYKKLENLILELLPERELSKPALHGTRVQKTPLHEVDILAAKLKDALRNTSLADNVAYEDAREDWELLATEAERLDIYKPPSPTTPLLDPPEREEDAPPESDAEGPSSDDSDLDDNEATRPQRTPTRARRHPRATTL